ncbi:MAG: transporter [Flaviaesturariibacter sp.]|nr:transporter [Flaviaesturariibacter sp.]
MTRLYSIALYLVAFLTISACSSDRKKDASAAQKAGPKPAARVDAFVVQTQTLSESIEIPGTIVSDESTEIHPEVSGRLTGLYVREGAIVGKGALLAKVYDADLQAQRRKLEVQLQQAQQTQNRYNELQKIGGISKQDYDVTRLQVSNIRADLDIIRTDIGRTEIRAPFTGKLGLKQTSTGAFVTNQSIITTIQKTTGLRIDFNVPEKYINQVKPGHYVNFTIDGSKRAYTAVVTATESGIAEATRSLTLRAQVKGDQGGLTPGSFAKVKIDFAPNTAALMIPTQAVVPQARGKKVYLINKGKVAFVDIVTGVRDSSNVEVVSGLKQGDTVAVTGILGLKPDAKVIVRKVINAKNGGRTDSTKRAGRP